MPSDWLYIMRNDLLMSYLCSDNGLDFKLQSAYKKYHSNESALLKVKRDILMNMNKQHESATRY